MRLYPYLLLLSCLVMLTVLMPPSVLSLTVSLTNGPLLGAVTATSAKIWVRTNRPIQLEVEYSQSTEFIDSFWTGQVSTTQERDLTGKVQLSELTPRTRYFYRIWANGTLLPGVYEFTTSPRTSEVTTFAFAVLSDFREVSAPVYTTVAQGAPAFLIFLGDFDHRDPSSLLEMRNMHRTLRGGETAAGEDFINHLSSFAFYHVWDDHDFGINESDKTFPGKQDALKAFREYFPTPPMPSGDGIWHKFRYAQAEFFMLDLRSQRDPNTISDGPNKSILGAEQKTWLKTALLNSTARWKFVMSSVPFNPTCKPFDSWAAFQTERREIINFIQQNGITGIIVISGDLHTGGALDDGTNSEFTELSVPHANIPVCSEGTPCRCHTAAAFPGVWSEGMICGIDNPGFGFITVKPESVVLRVIGVDGSTRMMLDVN